MSKRVKRTKSSVRHIGLDVSITSTGYCILDGDFNILKVGLVKSATNADIPDTVRFNIIWNKLDESVSFDCITDTVMIEAYAMQSRRGNILVRLAELTGMIKSRIIMDKLFPWSQVLKCSPSTLKKYVLGSGKAEKSLILKTLWKKWEIDIDQDDIGDAYALARMGGEIVRYAKDRKYVCQLKYEHDCIQSIMEQNNIEELKRRHNG